MAFCSNCGNELNAGAKFCAECGSPVTNTESKRKTVFEGDIHKCPHCGEALRAFETICPTCGTELRGAKSSSAISVLSEKLENATSEKQRIVIIKSFPIPNTKEDISDAWLTKIEQCYSKAKLSFGSHPDFEQIEALYLQIKADCADKERKIKYEEKAQREAQERAETAKGFKKSKLRITIIIFAVISALCVAVSFNDGKILSGIIAILMLATFVTAFLMGSGVIKEKVKNMRLLPLILAFVLFIPYLATWSSESIGGDSTRWDDILLNEHVPQPIMTSARVMTNSREEFYIYNIKCSQRDYYDYVNACKEFGYDHEITEEDEYSFEAYNEDGYQIKISYITTLTVELKIPMKMNQIEWPNSDIAKLVPQPKSLYGKIEWEHDYGFVIYIGNTTFAEYKEYVDSIYNAGFNIDYSKGDTHFWADNIDCYHVNVEYKGYNTMFIRIDEPDTIKIGVSPEEITGQQYQDVIEIFKNNGFKNVEAQEDGWNMFHKTGTVKKVTVNGRESFASSDEVKENAKIIIFYYK